MRGTDDKVVLITGVSGGIGRAVALDLGRAGATAVLGARRLDRVRSTVAEIEAAGGTARARELDVTSRDEVAAFAAAAIAAVDDEEPTWEDAAWY